MTSLRKSLVDCVDAIMATLVRKGVVVEDADALAALIAVQALLPEVREIIREWPPTDGPIQ
jgi:hypothetical protein